MSLEAVYWVLLGVGLGFLLLSLLFGEIFDFLDFLDLDIAGGDFAATPVLFAGLASFGAGGLLGLEAFGFGTGGSVVTGLVTGVVFGGLTAALFSALSRQQAGEGFDMERLVGERGRCSLAVGPGKVGKVTIHYGGMTRSLSAGSDQEIAVGQEVVVTDVVGQRLTVSPSQRDTTADST